MQSLTAVMVIRAAHSTHREESTHLTRKCGPSRRKMMKVFETVRAIWTTSTTDHVHSAPIQQGKFTQL